MSAHDDAAGFYEVLFTGLTFGYAAVSVRRAVPGGRTWYDRHVIAVSDRDMWLEAVRTAQARGWPLSAWPSVYAESAREGIGTAARGVHADGTHTAQYQAVVGVRWKSAPDARTSERFREAGGHLFATAYATIGVLRLRETTPRREVAALAQDVATTLGAEPLPVTTAFMLSGPVVAEWVTSPERAFTVQPVTVEDIAAAGLSSSKSPAVDT